MQMHWFAGELTMRGGGAGKSEAWIGSEGGSTVPQCLVPCLLGSAGV